jgi:hypothetical protein
MFNTISIDVLGHVIGGGKTDKDTRDGAGNDGFRGSNKSRGDGGWQERKGPIQIPQPGPRVGG